VSGYILEPLGGSLHIEVSVTGVNSGPCDHLGYPLYTRMFLRETLPTGEPTAMPSGEPTGVPSSVPSGEPSGAPSGEPSGQPTSSPSGQPSGEPSGQPTGQPTGQPSGQPSMEPSGQPSGQPSSQPTGVPSGVPSGEPSNQPSGEPTGQPTGEPSGVPSSHPTLVYPQSYSFAGGGDESNPVVWTPDSLGYWPSNNRRMTAAQPFYLSVEVFPTNFEVKANQYATVKVNGNAVVAHCTPEESCGSVWFSCVSELDVSGYILEPLGGSLHIEVSVTGVNSGPCDHLGYPLYTRMFLRETLPTGEPTAMPSGEPTVQPSVVPSGEPSLEPSGQPSGEPSQQPSGQPSGEPSCQPSNQPSAMPTSTPTLSFPLTYEDEKGGSSSVSFFVSQLGFMNRSQPKYLSVGVWPTDYADRADQWATVKIDGQVVVPYCTPSQSCGKEYYYCMLEQDVLPFINETLGGSFTVEVTTTGVNSGPCNHNGYPLYAHLHITEMKPTGRYHLSIWIFVGLCIGVVLFLMAWGWYEYSSQLKQRRKNYVPEEVDVELGDDNDDAIDDEELPYEDKKRVKPSRGDMYLRNLSKIAPMEENPQRFNSLLSPNFRKKPVGGVSASSQLVRQHSAEHDFEVPKSPAPPLRTQHSHLHISRTVDGMSIIDSLDS